MKGNRNNNTNSHPKTTSKPKVTAAQAVELTAKALPTAFKKQLWRQCWQRLASDPNIPPFDHMDLLMQDDGPDAILLVGRLKRRGRHVGDYVAARLTRQSNRRPLIH